MARREFQMAGVLPYEGPRPYWYIRYRRSWSERIKLNGRRFGTNLAIATRSGNARQHTVTLAPGGQKRDLSLLKNQVIPYFGSMKLCDIGINRQTYGFRNFQNYRLRVEPTGI